MGHNVVASGSFTSDSTAHDIALRSDFDMFKVWNWTQTGLMPTPGVGVEFMWRRGLADNAGWMWTKQAGANAIDLEQITTGGFLRVDTSVTTPEAEKAMVSNFVTAGNPANVSVTAHGYSNGDRVRIYDNIAMLEISGLEFTIGNVSANDFELSYLDTSGGNFIASTSGNVRRIPNPPNFRPERNYVTAISKAASAVVTMSLTHGLVVGDELRLSIPSAFGMTQIDGLRGSITAISTANNTVTVDINSTNFDAFLYPLSASAGSPALAIPFGTNVQAATQAFQNQTEILMRLGGGADGPGGVTADVMYWEALKSDIVITE